MPLHIPWGARWRWRPAPWRGRPMAWRPPRGGRIVPHDEAILRLAGALLPGQNDEPAARRARWMTPETSAPMGADATPCLPAVASCSSRPAPSVTVTISAS